jgi:hypothetical protein
MHLFGAGTTEPRAKTMIELLSGFVTNPWLLLAALPLAAIPIVLHLLTLHRLKTVELSTYRFLFDSYVQQRRRMQFLEALLAMLRTLFVLGLIILVAHPALQSWGGLFSNGSGRDVIFLVDCSASMNAQTHGVKAIDRARTVAETVAKKLDSSDRLTLIRVVSKPEEIFNRFSADTKAITKRLQGLETSPARANLFAALMHLFGPDAPRRDKAVVYLFTDCQASGWREAKNQGLDKVIPAGTEFIVVNVGSNEAVSNLAVVGDAPGRQRAIAGLPLILRPRVANYSKNETRATVQVLVDEKEVASFPLTLKPNETASHPVIYVPAEPGLHKAVFKVQKIDDEGKVDPDRFTDDDLFRFTVAVVPRVKVLLVNGNPTTDPRDSDTLYLRTALEAPSVSDEKEPGKSGPADAGKEKELARSLDVKEIPEALVNPEELRETGVVILANCGALNDQQFDWLRTYVQGGGGLLIFPGDRIANPELYNTRFFPTPAPQKEQLTGVRLGPPEGDLERTDVSPERLASIDFAHPALTVFDDPEGRYLKSLRFYRWHRLLLPEKRENTWALAEFANGAPALVESRFGDGLVVLAAFPANAKWTNCPLKPEFVPLVLRLVGHVERRPEIEVPSVVPPGGTVEISVARSWDPVEARVSYMNGPPSPPLTFERSGSRLLAAYDDPSASRDPGYYTVEVRGGGSKNGRAGFAINLAPEESDFTPISETQLRELLPSAKVRLVDVTAETQQLLGSLDNRVEVWRPLIFLLFALITGEFLLATLGGRRRAGQ